MTKINCQKLHSLNTFHFDCATLKRCAVTLLLFNALATLTTTAAPVSQGPVTTPGRWHSPCAGSSAMVDLGGDWGELDSEYQFNPAESYFSIHEKAMSFRVKVQQLKTKYSLERFNNENYEEESADFKLEGMPEVEALTPENLKNIEGLTTAHETFEHFARIAVFLEQARLDEIAYESSEYKTHFEEIEEHGVYWILCELHRVILGHESQLSSSVTHDVMALELRDISNRALRHTRDFVVLRDLDKLLARANLVFASLHEASQ